MFDIEELTMTTTKSRLTKAEHAEMDALNAKKLDVCVGYNVIRHFFAEKADAERFLELIVKWGADRPVFYGSECEFRVAPSNWKGKENPCWEVAEG
jgi:hypothetical protein